MIVLSFVVQWQRHRQLYCLNLHVAFEKTLSSSDQAIHYFQMKWNGNFQSILLYQRLRLVMDTHLWLLTGEKFLLTCLWLQDIRMICLQLREWNCSFCFCSIMYAFGGFAGLMFNSFLQYSQGKFGLSRINFNTLENCSECGNIKSVMTEAFWTFNNYGNDTVVVVHTCQVWWYVDWSSDGGALPSADIRKYGIYVKALHPFSFLPSPPPPPPPTLPLYFY